MDLQSILGYARNSPFSSSPYLDIQTPEGLIDMANTPIDLLGIDNLGNAKVMKANSKKPYKFKGNQVREIPMKKGGKTKKKIARGNPYQKGGYTPQQLFDFLFDDDVEDPVKNQVPVAPTTTEVDAQVALNDFEAQKRQMGSMENDQMAMEIMDADMGNPYRQQQQQGFRNDILSAGQFGAQNVGNFGRQIYGQLASDLGYAPTANSIFRSKEQQDALIASGAPASKDSWHLTGNAIDLKPTDWHRLSNEQQQFYRSNYDVVYHNNHYHIEPK